MSQRVSNTQVSDPKPLLAQGLAIQKAELVAAMMYIGCIWGDQSPSRIMEAARAGERDVPHNP